MAGRIDVRKLEADARKSCCRETFIVLDKNPIVRIGAGARVCENGDYLLFIEINLTLCPGKSIPNTVSLEKIVQLAKALRDIGFEISCFEGQINFERAVAASEMNEEYSRVLGIISDSEFPAFIQEPAAVE